MSVATQVKQSKEVDNTLNQSAENTQIQKHNEIDSLINKPIFYTDKPSIIFQGTNTYCDSDGQWVCRITIDGNKLTLIEKLSDGNESKPEYLTIKDGYIFTDLDNENYLRLTENSVIYLATGSATVEEEYKLCN